MAGGGIGGHAWLEGMCGGGGHAWQGACVAGGQAWQRAYVERETATAADGTHPTGMHSCYSSDSSSDKDKKIAFALV